MDESTPAEPTVFGALVAHKAVVVVGVLVALALGAAYDVVGRSPTYETEATLLVHDPVAGGIFGDARAVDQERYAADQVGVLRSTAVADRAALAADRALPGHGFTSGGLRRGLVVSGDPESNLIGLRFTSSGREAAKVALDSVIAAYEGLQGDRVAGAAASATAQVDGAIAALDAELDVVEAEIRSIVAGASSLGPTGQATLTGLQYRQQELVERRADLIARRAQVQSDAATSDSGVTVSSLPDLPRAASSTLVRTLLVAGLLGLAAGGGTAYLLALSRRRVRGRFDAEALLGAPLLAELPDLRRAEGAVALPVALAPTSSVAESFRFVARSAEVELARLGGRRLAVVGTTGRAGGTTTIAANVALAAAAAGRRVLLVDADPARRSSRALLAASRVDAPAGLDLDADLERRPWRVDIGGHRLDVRPAAEDGGGAGDGSPEAIHADYDLVVVDVPPLLDVAAATAALRASDVTLLVVHHDEEQTVVEEAVRRLRFIGAHVAGYAYVAASTSRGAPVARSAAADGGGRRPRAHGVPRRSEPPAGAADLDLDVGVGAPTARRAR